MLDKIDWSKTMKYPNIINKLSLEQKAMLMSGKNTWETWTFEEEGVPSIFLADGPHGIRKQLGSADHLGLNESIKATAFPTAATLANSWDVDLIERVGEALGREAVELGVNVLLGPGMNIKRNPMGGRNFEYFSEDPILTGELASAMIKGIQSNGIAASPKHYAVNSQELRRMSVDSVVDERTLREIYLQGFEIAVETSQPKFLMTSYNPVNGVYANEHEHLLQDILYGEWGYKGAVVTDWGGSNDHVEGVRQGSHLEMPATGRPGALELVEAVQTGRLDESLLDQRVDELLDVLLQIQIPNPGKDSLEEATKKAHHQIAYQAAQESIVLLKNTNQALPLSGKESVAFIGDFLYEARYQGAGSSTVNPTQLDNLIDLKEQYNFSEVQHTRGYRRDGKEDPGLLNEAIDLSKKVDKVVIFMGLTEISESEGIDRTHIRLEKNQLDLVKAIRSVNEHVVIVLSGGSVVELPFADDVDAIIHSYLSGQAGARAILDILTGRCNPSGKLNETYPLTYSDVPNEKYFPGLELTAEYRDGLYVGYRYYDKVEAPVRYPFGHGLSYTSFAYGGLTVEGHRVQVTVSNTGDLAGSEVVQVYVQKASEYVFRPVKELVAFAKVHLEAGESKVVNLELSKHAFEFFNPQNNQWEVEAGAYDILVGASSRDIRLEETVELEGIDAKGLYHQTQFETYFTGKVKEVSAEDFEALLGRPIPESHWDKKAPLTHNDSISQLYYAKSPIGRLVYKVITALIERSNKKGKPNLNLYFNYNMTFRAIQKMTLGMVNHAMVDDILYIVNGHFFSGVGRLVKNYFLNQKVNKAGESND